MLDSLLEAGTFLPKCRCMTDIGALWCTITSPPLCGSRILLVNIVPLTETVFARPEIHFRKSGKNSPFMKSLLKEPAFHFKATKQF